MTKSNPSAVVVNTPGEKSNAKATHSELVAVGVGLGLQMQKRQPDSDEPDGKAVVVSVECNNEEVADTSTSPYVGPAIQPLRSPETFRQNQQLPGAIPVGGFGSRTGTWPLVPGRLSAQESSGYSLVNLNLNANHSDQTTTPTGTTDDVHGLAVANPVRDNMQTATPHEDRPRQKPFPSRNKVLILATITAVFILAVAIVVPSVLLTKKHPSNNPTTSTPTTSYPATQAPTSFTASILALFPHTTVQAILNNSDSPQARAFQWLLQDSVNFSLYSVERIIQKFTLATLYYATNGNAWTRRDSWLNHTVHECLWFQQPSFSLRHVWSIFLPEFLKDFSDDQVGPPCDSYGIFLNLWLDQNNLKGSLPLELYLLTSLQTISFGLNPLEGTIPTEVGLLTNLQGLAMTDQQAMGTLPSEVGLLTKLRALRMNNQQLTGTVPSEVFQLTNLTTLIFSQNPMLQSTISTEIVNLSKLYWLDYADAGVTGTLPSEVGLLTGITFMLFYGCSLSGTLPTTLGQLTNIQVLSMFDNDFTGPIPTELGLIPSVNLISLRSNQFTGLIPSELGLLTNLAETLNLRNNELSGTIPTQLGLLSQLRELEFRNNQLTGAIPSELAHITKMGYLSFANNSLEGTIPLELSSLQETLHTLSLEGNSLLTGIIPEGVCNMNGTCIGDLLDACESFNGLSFDCSSFLCGCNCTCVS